LKVFIDTNVLVSASRDRAGTPRLALEKAMVPPSQAFVCDQNLEELRHVYYRKFPDELDALRDFLAESLPYLEVVQTPSDHLDEEAKIRDIKDRPILRAAIMAGADIILTGDKDFLESGIERPLIVTPAEFVRG